MTGFYGHRWVSSYGDDPGGIAGDTWAAGLATCTPAQLAQGMRACSQSLDPWPPSMQQFRMWCIGIPDFADVVQQLRPGAVELSPFVRHMHLMLDPHSLRLADERTARQIMRDAYELTARFVSQGGELPRTTQALVFDRDAERKAYSDKHFQTLQQLTGELHDFRPA